MSTNDQKTPPPPPPSGLSIGLILGGIVLAMVFIGVAIFFLKRRQGGGNAVPSGPPTAANGLGAMNQGSNAVPRTNMNLNAGRTTV